MKYGVVVIGFAVLIAGGVATWFGGGYELHTPSSPPQIVTAQSVGANQLEISWSAVPGATRYYVSIAPGHVTFNAADVARTFVLGVPVHGTSYTYTLARSLTEYTVWVTPEARVMGSGWIAGPHSAGQTVSTP